MSTNDAPRHTTIVNSDQAIAEVNVRFVQEDDGRWFRLLNWLVDSGLWASLPEAGQGVLVVLARHASPDGTSLPSFETLIAQSGKSRSAVYRGLKQLRAVGLIEILPHGAWRIFPGREFAGRRPRDGTPSPTSGTGPPPASHQRDEKSHQRDDPSHQRDVLLRLRNSDDDAETSGAVGGGVVDELVRKDGGNFRREDAQRLLDRHGAERVRDALDSARAAKAKGKLRTGIRQFVCWFLNSGQPLWSEVEDERRRHRERELAGRLNEIVVPRLRSRPGAEQLLTRAFGTVRQTVAAGVITERDLEGGADEAFDLLLGKAEAATGLNERAFLSPPASGSPPAPAVSRTPPTPNPGMSP